MSTRALIGIRQKDGSITSVYNHSDGFPSYLGKLLIENYPDESDAKAIIALGDLSVLGERLTPRAGEPHTFEKRTPSVTVAYHRDRGEPLQQTKDICTSSFVKTAKHAWGRFAYLFDCELQQWIYSDLYSKRAECFAPLTQAACN